MMTEKPGEILYIDKYARGYPEILLQYERMPEGLYYRGALPDPSFPAVAIVGARACSQYGKRQTLKLARVLAENGVQIISGLACGIDRFAHEGALEGKGRTYAVLGCGADICYPSSNRLLFDRIPENGGGILSEFPPGTPPEAWHFPVRNRIISALAEVVIVIEARKKSGSLITANYALEQGKTIYALPGRVNDPLSCGCNDLIRQGAFPLLSADQVLEDLGIEKSSGAEKEKDRRESDCRETPGPAPAEKKLLSCLSDEPKTLEELERETGLSFNDLTCLIVKLEFQGRVEEPARGSYCKAC